MYTYEKEIQSLLRKLGANATYIGFQYVTFGVSKTIAEPDSIVYISKGLYVDIAFKFNTTINGAERNIRTIKEVVWRCGNPELLQEIFYTDQRPTNSAFIDGLANYIKRTVVTQHQKIQEKV